MAMDFTNAFVEIIKKEKLEDGTMKVYGKATDDTLDVDKQICDSDWLDKAMPEWFKSGGNIREMHTSSAAGVAQEYERKEDGHYINTLIVDPLAIKKTEMGVYQGFSIGIKAPRIVRDTKAANGRIIDGQIVEISLVDRPANPSAKLMLAKSVEGEASLVKVEEMIDGKTQAQQISDAVKALAPEIVKFDQAAFDTARNALADLISIEAQEMITEGSNEKDSIEYLLDAIKCLFKWYENEIAEGEVPGSQSFGEVIGDMVADALDGKSTEADKTDKCLECGCHQPAETHGDPTVSTADMVEMSAKSVDTDIIPEPTTEEISPVADIEDDEEEDSVDDSTDKTLLADEKINEMIEKAVKSVVEPLLNKVSTLESANEAVVEKNAKLEAELATAKSLAVGGGPKRTGIKAAGPDKVSEMVSLAKAYRAKASATQDAKLAEGYMDIARDFEEKISKSQNPDNN